MIENEKHFKYSGKPCMRYMQMYYSTYIHLYKCMPL